MYDKTSHLLTIEIFGEHQYLDNSDLDQILTAEVNLADLKNLHGDFIESTLYDVEKKEVGKLVLTIETFQRAKGCYVEKVSSKVFFDAVKEEFDKQV